MLIFQNVRATVVVRHNTTRYTNHYTIIAQTLKKLSFVLVVQPSGFCSTTRHID